MLGISNKYLRYAAFITVLGIGIYAGYTYLFSGPPKQGTQFTIAWTSLDQQQVYDQSLPNDMNYTKLWGNQVYFLTRLNVNDYSNASSPEITSLQFHDKQSIRSWIDKFQIPNLLKNMLKAMFDMSREDFNREDKYGAFSWGPSEGRLQGFLKYFFIRTGDPSYNIITLTMRDSDTFVVPEKVWEFVIKVPFTGTDYDLTFTRYPRP